MFVICVSYSLTNSFRDFHWKGMHIRISTRRNRVSTLLPVPKRFDFGVYRNDCCLCPAVSIRAKLNEKKFWLFVNDMNYFCVMQIKILILNKVWPFRLFPSAMQSNHFCIEFFWTFYDITPFAKKFQKLEVFGLYRFILLINSFISIFNKILHWYVSLNIYFEIFVAQSKMRQSEEDKWRHSVFDSGSNKYMVCISFGSLWNKREDLTLMRLQYWKSVLARNIFMKSIIMMSLH